MSKILIVDDDESVRLLVTTKLKRHGYDFIQADSGKEALSQLLKDKDIELILLDYDMPEVNGISTFVQIREVIGDYPPVIMVTGHSSTHLAVEFMKLGGKDFIEKPIDADILMLRIEKVLDSTIKDKYIKELQREKSELATVLKTAATMNHEMNSSLFILSQIAGAIPMYPEKAIILSRHVSNLSATLKQLSGLRAVKTVQYLTDTYMIDLQQHGNDSY